MKKIERYSNWCEIDRLDGVDLQDGEQLKVQWEDGTISIETVFVDKFHQRMSEQGGYYDVPYSIAHIYANCRGTKTPIKLIDSNIKCERINAPKPEIKSGFGGRSRKRGAM